MFNNDNLIPEGRLFQRIMTRSVEAGGSEGCGFTKIRSELIGRTKTS